MNSLVERYPQAQRLPLSNTPADETALLTLLEPYLGWSLAEIDTASTDILISDASVTADGKACRLLLLSGQAVSLWLRHHFQGRENDGAVIT